MILDKRPYTFDRVVRIGIGAALIWGLISLLGVLSDVLIPFAAALLLAYLLDPLVGLIQKKVRRRGAAVLIALTGVAVVAAVLAWAIVPLIVGQIVGMGRVVSDLVSDSEVAERAAKHLPPDLWQSIREYIAREDVQAFFKTDNFLNLVQAVGRKLLPGVWNVLAGTASFVVGVVGLAVVALYMVFLLLDWEALRERWKRQLPPGYREPVAEFFSNFEQAMNRYFRGQAMIAFVVGVVYAIGFWIIDLPMGIVLGLFIGLLNMVPYLQIIGLIPAFLFAMIHAIDTGGSIWLSMGLVLVVTAVSEVLQSVVLVPRIMGKVTGLSPWLILLSLSVWGKLLGFFGLLIALPMTCLLFAYYNRLVIASSASRANADAGAS